MLPVALLLWGEPLPSMLAITLLLAWSKAAVSDSVSIQCTPDGCLHSLTANAWQISNVLG